MTLRVLRLHWRLGGCEHASTCSQPRSLSYTGLLFSMTTPRTVRYNNFRSRA